MGPEDHVALIRRGVEGAGPRWLELGAGDGEFTLALAEVLRGRGDLVALDVDPWALGELVARLGERFPDTRVDTRTQDFTQGLPPGPFDGVLAANSLHFALDPVPVLAVIRDVLAPDGRLVVVEHEADHANPYVPHPIPLARLRTFALAAGLTEPHRLHGVQSRLMGSIYSAVCERPGGEVLHSRPHGEDREE